jgi:hypothetical protein
MPRISLIDLQTNRRPLAVATLVAVVVGLLVAFKIALPPTLRHHSVGLGTESALVDTSKSQLSTLGSPTSNQVSALAFRASLLASLMTTPSFERAIARGAGIPATNLQIIPDVTVAAATPAPAVVPNSPGEASRPDKVTIIVPTVAAGQLPILQVTTQATTPKIAAALATSAIAVASANVKSPSQGQHISPSNQLVIRKLGPAASGWQGVGLSPVWGIVAAIVLLLLEAAGVLVLKARRRRPGAEPAPDEVSPAPSGSADPDGRWVSGATSIPASVVAGRRRK